MENTITVRETVLGDGQPKICVPLTAADREQLQQQLEQVCAVPHDMVEFRADYYEAAELETGLEGLLKLIREKIGNKILLFTFRTGAEGGERRIAFEEYRELNLRAAASKMADFVDLELFALLGAQEEPQAFVRKLQESGCKVIGSSHDFSGTPDTQEMIGRLVRMQELGMDMTKLAVMPHNRQDTVRLLDASVQMWEQFADRPYVTMAMGDNGAISRLIGHFSGSAVTFASAGSASAPGQIAAQTVQDYLNLSGRIFE